MTSTGNVTLDSITVDLMFTTVDCPVTTLAPRTPPARRATR
ncbi:hypothetical protein [Nocardioides sp.]